MLYGVLIFVIIVLIMEKLVNKDKKEETIKDENTSFFTKKEYLLTQTELKFYKVLKEITDKLELSLFCQVAMYEVVNCKDYKNFNRIKNKSIDFVITEKNCKIKLCIELDDSTHNQQKRVERDKLVNDIFKSVNTKLLRIKTQNYYDVEKLKNIIQESL